MVGYFLGVSILQILKDPREGPSIGVPLKGSIRVPLRVPIRG